MRLWIRFIASVRHTGHCHEKLCWTSLSDLLRGLGLRGFLPFYQRGICLVSCTCFLSTALGWCPWGDTFSTLMKVRVPIQGQLIISTASTNGLFPLQMEKKICPALNSFFFLFLLWIFCCIPRNIITLDRFALNKGEHLSVCSQGAVFISVALTFHMFSTASENISFSCFLPIKL